MLGEQVGWRRWLAVIVGFAGLLLMVRPSGEGIPYYYFFPLFTALLLALRDGRIQQLRKELEHRSSEVKMLQARIHNNNDMSSSCLWRLWPLLYAAYA